MASQPSTLEQQIIARIERSGPVTFRDFMQTALYDEYRGYYNTDRLKIGPEGDYYTSSNVHPVFGAILARRLVDLWNKDSQAPLTLVELGAGTGQLAFDILSAIGEEHAPIAPHMKYLIVETSPAMRALQRQRLQAFKECVEWRALETLENTPLEAVFFSNELVDAMPVHRVRFFGGRLEELYVTARREEAPTDTGAAMRMRFVWGDPSTNRLREYLDRMDVKLPEGHIVEAGLDAIDWLGRVSRAIKRGHLITIDYGDIAGHLYSADRREGTIRSFYRHRLVESPLERAGEQDITASVNFTALMEYGRDSGLETVSYERQSAFLLRLGLIDRIAEMGATKNVDDLKSRLAIKNLFVPGGVSDNFRVLIQRKLR